jgi:hypothetical protein
MTNIRNGGVPPCQSTLTCPHCTGLVVEVLKVKAAEMNGKNEASRTIKKARTSIFDHDDDDDVVL